MWVSFGSYSSPPKTAYEKQKKRKFEPREAGLENTLKEEKSMNTETKKAHCQERYTTQVSQRQQHGRHANTEKDLKRGKRIL